MNMMGHGRTERSYCTVWYQYWCQVVYSILAYESVLIFKSSSIAWQQVLKMKTQKQKCGTQVQKKKRITYYKWQSLISGMNFRFKNDQIQVTCNRKDRRSTTTSKKGYTEHLQKTTLVTDKSESTQHRQTND